MSGVLVVAERGHRVTGEAIAAARLVSESLGEALLLTDCLPEPYTADGAASAVEQVIRRMEPAVVVFPHTYQVRDFAAKLATRFGRALVSDVIGFRVENGQLVLVRQLFQGKLNCDVRVTAPAPAFFSVQAGAWRADSATVDTAAFMPQTEPAEVRARPEPPFQESARAVDLASAEIIVAVGRGIKEKEHIPLAERLAAALGGELAASRPICDNGWLPMERQVGSSGQTVAPKLYIAAGISGAIQHVVGMKGSKTIVAINKDANAPIFEVADYGLVGDLFEILPALTEAVKKAKG